MKLVRVFAMGLGLGYLIWSGAGRKLVEKAQEVTGRGPALAPGRDPAYAGVAAGPV